jgi:7-cyano-7-deazaguanine synthase
MAKNVVISLSGGMDSSTLLLRCVSEYDNVTAISFDYGQKHRVELERAKSLVEYLNEKGFDIKYQVIKLDGLVNLLNSALTEGGEDVVPNRNKIFASLVQAVALSEAMYNGYNTDIALGIHAGDHAIYPDCRQEFRDADDAAFRIGNWEADKVGYFTPYLDTDKLGILQDGQLLIDALELDFVQVYKRTNTSYKPYPSGNSDYKSASSVERIEAFIELGVDDPVQYEDETGPVDYAIAKAHVKKLLAEHEQ